MVVEKSDRTRETIEQHLLYRSQLVPPVHTTRQRGGPIESVADR